MALESDQSQTAQEDGRVFNPVENLISSLRQHTWWELIQHGIDMVARFFRTCSLQGYSRLDEADPEVQDSIPRGNLAALLPVLVDSPVASPQIWPDQEPPRLDEEAIAMLTSWTQALAGIEQMVHTVLVHMEKRLARQIHYVDDSSIMWDPSGDHPHDSELPREHPKWTRPITRGAPGRIHIEDEAEPQKPF
ncbi:hypothetical protein N7492_009735 [Penicillium capsulatum]|uniref:Uncharacterized protein n=1 Tax=Penicillium capsulatum TaxID=69766 RepID=A0A9W9HL05_9EURO|nr:hypothetical protein N7492_010720 [Penicillium capsulatum]KAJ5152455.1 hypothetical protein N7492_009735 [Penicillium capsulatum]KAJ6114053.1 hypothetical protein N7512_007498 [Penicillium capsulatum]KAJ6114182.1 hypothetical protein N7512_007627 [Penicillium capsulatum]